MKMRFGKGVAFALAFVLVASSVAFAPKTNAAAKVSLAKKATVTVGKAKVLKITAKGYKIKKVKSVSEGQNVKIKTSKKSVTITAKKGTEGLSDNVATIVTAKKGKKTKTFKFFTAITIKGNANQKVSEKHIKTVDDLKAITGKSGVKYILDNDIDMTGWTEPIKYMYDSVDGNGYALKNLSVPFIAKLYGGTVTRLTFDVNMTTVYSLEDEKYVAPIGYIGPGQADQIATVKDCRTTGSINIVDVESEDVTVYVGGLVGRNPNNYGLVDSCVNKAAITVKGDLRAAVGGIIGEAAGLTDKVIVNKCLNTGDIDAEVKSYMGVGVGGIVGYGGDFSIAKDCLNKGSVYGKITGGKTYGAGGIMGAGDFCLVNCVSLGKCSYGVYGGQLDEDTIKSWAATKVMYKNVYCSSESENEFNWRKNAVEVEGVHKVSDITDVNSFAGLDFDYVWIMTPYGPDLRNIS